MEEKLETILCTCTLIISTAHVMATHVSVVIVADVTVAIINISNFDSPTSTVPPLTLIMLLEKHKHMPQTELCNQP